MLSMLILAAAPLLTNANIPPAPEVLVDKIVVVSCPKQAPLLTNLSQVPAGCKVIKEYTIPSPAKK